MSNGYSYLASPYTKYPAGLRAAYLTACLAAGSFIKAGIMVFSPIAHSHGIASMSPELGTDHASWRAYNETMLALADRLIVVCLPGWRDSEGIRDEIAFAAARQPPMPIFYWRLGEELPGSLNPPTE
jgi:hypothetical protein